jgi:hypothetical protein
VPWLWPIRFRGDTLQPAGLPAHDHAPSSEPVAGLTEQPDREPWLTERVRRVRVVVDKVPGAGRVEGSPVELRVYDPAGIRVPDEDSLPERSPTVGRDCPRFEYAGIREMPGGTKSRVLANLAAKDSPKSRGFGGDVSGKGRVGQVRLGSLDLEPRRFDKAVAELEGVERNVPSADAGDRDQIPPADLSGRASPHQCGERVAAPA